MNTASTSKDRLSRMFLSYTEIFLAILRSSIVLNSLIISLECRSWLNLLFPMLPMPNKIGNIDSLVL
jgi:hypothetical protein